MTTCAARWPMPAQDTETIGAIESGVGQRYGVQGGDDRHFQAIEEVQDEPAVEAAPDTEFMLQGNDIGPRRIDIGSCARAGPPNPRGPARGALRVGRRRRRRGR